GCSPAALFQSHAHDLLPQDRENVLGRKGESTPMVSMVSPRPAEDSDDLLVVDSPSLRGRLGESGFSDRPPLITRPSFGRRASRALIRYLIACGVGVAGTLAWQSYGDGAKQTIATFGTEHGLPMAWLSYAETTKADALSRPNTQAATAA